MVTIVLDIADNGVVKVLEDDNINGAGESFISKVIYDFDEDTNFKNRIKFLKELCLDIGLQLGNDIDKTKLNISVGSGLKYKHTKQELLTKIKACESLVSKYKKELKDYEA
tara:strand:- start:1010 stop:1342 length:333 start_codon:yes stop_codon:yes gene_type:complete